VAYLGVTPTQEFSSVAKQSVAGDGSVSYTLNKGVSDANDLAVFVNDVRQEPGVAYTATGNTITFTANLESTDDCYILHIGRTFSSAESPGIEDKATQKVLTITTDGHLVPTANVTYDLGTSDLRFRDIYLSGSSIELGDHSITANATHISMGNVVTTGVMTGNGALVTSLNASELTTGTIPLARLPDDVTIVNDLTIGGDFIVNGNTTTIAANELKVEDSLIQLATNNEISDTIDIGFVGHYSNDGGTTALHTGFFRDASNEYYYLFNGYEEDAFDTATPPSTIDRSANTFTLANFVANNVGMGFDPFLSNNYSTLNIRSTTGGQLLMGRDSGTNDWDFFAYSASTHTAIGTSANTYLTFHTDSTGVSNERMRIDEEGRVGIGITPSYTLDIQAIASSFNPVRFSGHSGSIDAYLYTDTAYWSIGDTTGYGGNLWGGNKTSNFLHAHTNGSERMRIDSAGRVQIGTTSAYNSYADNLVVEDDSNAGITIATTDNTARTSLYFADSNTGSATYQGIIEYRHANDRMHFWTNHTDHNIVIDSVGRVGIGNSSPSSILTVNKDTGSTPTVYINNSGPNVTEGVALKVQATGRGTGVADVSIFSVHNNTTELFTVRNDGNVGIGDQSPSYPLEVYRLVPTSGIISRFASGSSGGWIQLADTNGSWQMGSTSNGLEFYADAPTSQYRLALTSSGNLGIGTRSPRSTLDLGADSSGSTQISWHSSSTRSLGNIWTSRNGGRLTFGQALKGSQTTNNGYLGAYTGTWAPSAMELSYGVINLFADAAQSLTYDGAFTPTQVAQFHNSSGFTSYKPIRTSFAGNTEHLELNNTGASSWTFYSYNDGHMYINCHPSGGSDATRFTIKSDGSVGIGTAAPSKLLDVTSAGGFKLTDDGNYSSIWIGSDQMPVQYPYYRVDSWESDGSGYFWAFGHRNSSSGVKSINMLLSDGTNPYGFFKNNLYVGTFTSNEYNSSYPGLSTPVAIRGTSNTTSFIGGDGTGHFAVGTNSVKTGVTSSGVVTQTFGPLIHGRTQGSHSSSEPRCILGWFTYSGPYSNSASYLHMKTNLWAGGSPTGNTEYTMSLFRYRGYCYTGSNAVGSGMVGWHNWNGSLPNQTVHNDTGWSITQSSYVSSDGYVVLVAYMLAAYCQIIIDWDQWGGYDFRERRVTATAQHSSATGYY